MINIETMRTAHKAHYKIVNRKAEEADPSRQHIAYNSLTTATLAQAIGVEESEIPRELFNYARDTVGIELLGKNSAHVFKQMAKREAREQSPLAKLSVAARLSQPTESWAIQHAPYSSRFSSRFGLN